jgi:hypothetical protein
VKPLPLIDAALTVTAEPPVELSVTDWVAGVFNVTLPNDRLLLLRLNVAAPGFNCRVVVLETPLEEAVSVTDCAVLTEDTVAVKLALVALAGTRTVPGTVTAALLLLNETLSPPLGAAPLNVTVQPSVVAPVTTLARHKRPVKELEIAVSPLPLSATIDVAPVEELLLMVSCPVDELAVVGSN